MSILTDIAKWFKPQPLPGPIKGQSASVYDAFQSGVAKPGDTISAPKVNIGNLGQIGQQSKSGSIRQPVPVTGVATSPYSSATDPNFLTPPATSGQPTSTAPTYNDPRGSATTDAFLTPPATSGQDMQTPQKSIPPPVLTTGESLAVAKSHGLEGMGYSFAGMTSAEANARAKEAKDKLLSQTSALTSGTFNPQTIAGVNKTMEAFKERKDNITMDSWKKYSKESDTKNLVTVSSSDIAKNFASLSDFQNAQKSPDFMKSIDPFIKAGGTMADIAAKITPDVQGIQPETDLASFLANQNNLQNQPVPIKQIDNVDGTITKVFKDGTTVTTDANGSPVNNQEAYNKLLPETLAGQNEIARLANIPEELKKHFFGTPEQMGVYQQEIELEKEKIKNLEKKAADAKATAREKAQYAMDKNRSDIATAKATNELNRLNAKNYMTGMLAKLGALMTTGAAPLALATLEEKYQRSAQELDTKLSFANREIEINLTDTINEIENNLADKEYSVREDLSKSAREMQKEIFDAQSKAQREIYTISSSSAKAFRTAMASHEKDTATNQAKYATTYMSLAGKGFSQAQILQILTSTGIVDVTKLTPAMQKLLAPKDKITEDGVGTSLERVLAYPSALNDMTPTVQNKIKNEIFKMSNPPASFVNRIQQEKRMSLSSSNIQAEWNKFKDSISGSSASSKNSYKFDTTTKTLLYSYGETATSLDQLQNDISEHGPQHVYDYGDLSDETRQLLKDTHNLK